MPKSALPYRGVVVRVEAQGIELECQIAMI